MWSVGEGRGERNLACLRVRRRSRAFEREALLKPFLKLIEHDGENDHACQHGDHRCGEGAPQQRHVENGAVRRVARVNDDCLYHGVDQQLRRIRLRRGNDRRSPSLHPAEPRGLGGCFVSGRALTFVRKVVADEPIRPVCDPPPQ